MSPTVFAIAGGAHAWIQDGIGWIRLPGGQWQPLVEAAGIGGRALNSQEVWVLVMEAGWPT